MRVLGAVPLGYTVPGPEPAPSPVEGWHVQTVFMWASVNFRDSRPNKCWDFFCHFNQERIPQTRNEITQNCVIHTNGCSDLGNEKHFL
jgi:hypothetical protein